MSFIDVRGLKPVGEFGSREWCEACASYGANSRERQMPLDLCWGFSEVYTCPPERLISPEWPQSGYYFMVENGVVSGGAEIPEGAWQHLGFMSAFVGLSFVINRGVSTECGAEAARH